jgi:hypothetical protein
VSAYISNGTEGELWMADNCERCARDHSWHADGDTADQCPVLIALVIGEDGIEGLVEHADRYMPARLKCTYWKPCVGCGVDPTDVPTSWKVEL